MLDLKRNEEEILKFWEKEKIYEKRNKKNAHGKDYSLLDGPPYANFTPHVGHIKNTVFKDLIIRIALMQGKKVVFQPGFDTHGLPVENMVEKKLGLKNKREIEKFGIGNFMRECKESAILNKELWMHAYRNLGSVYDGIEPYLTYENYYIDSAWWAFAEMYKKGMLYEGEKPVMWCPHCETSLAGYEVTDSYKEVVDPGVYVLFKLKNSDEHLLVYTTTPWTLPANVAVAVAPNENYVCVDINGRKIILAESRLAKLSEMGFGYMLIRNLKGEELVGKRYEPLLDVPLQRELAEGKYGKAHVVIASISLLKERVSSKLRTKKGAQGEDVFEEFVTTSEGTGLVHTAPGHGKTDNLVGQHYRLAAVSPLDNKCNFTEKAGFEGFVKDADYKIIEKLEKEGKLLFQEKIKHSYPLCWRCKSPLIFRLSTQLFFRIEEVKKRIQKLNKKVKWYPEFSRERFDNWVANAEDWNISRQRYWGIPIPIWKSSDGEEIIISRLSELEKLSGKKIPDAHLAEEISFRKNGKEFKKIKGILDVWFDSGVAPWASMGYPYMNKELFENNFPVSRINEAQDQIRGWFYSLLFCSAAVFEKPAYKEVSMTGWVLDKNGNKMSKSLGNIVGAEQALDELGSDILRYYFCWDVAPYETQKFNLDIAKKEIGKVFNTLWNLQNLAEKGEVKTEDISDEWILSKLESLTKDYLMNLENFEFHVALRAMSDFIVNSLSRGYIQMNRDNEKGKIIAHCLKRILILLAPVSVFFSDKMWQKLREKNIVEEESVHLCDWPNYEKKRINKDLEEMFVALFAVIEKGMAKRDEERIGLRWPLASATVTLPENKKLDKIREIAAKQLNVKKIDFKKGKEIYVEIDLRMTPELEAEGFARELGRSVQAERKKMGLEKKDFIDLEIYVDGETKEKFIRKSDFIKNRTNAKKIHFADGKMTHGTEITIKNKRVFFRILSCRNSSEKI